MKKFLYLTLLFSISLMAQNQRFIYDYKFVRDSTNTAETKTELMHLDVTPKSSRFYSYEVYKQDSTRMVEFDKQIKTTGSMNVVTSKFVQGGLVRYSVSKTYPEFNTFLHTRIGRDAYKIDDDTALNWKIESEKQKIGEFNTQKATTYFQGRKWIAWFATEIPIQEGPYKFRGLPGLIVKISNDNQTHSFELKAIKKLENPIDFTKESMTFSNKEIEIDYKTYTKLWKEERSDPMKSMRQMLNSGMISNIRDANGNPMDAEKLIREREKTVKESLKKDNNVIDLTLLK